MNRLGFTQLFAEDLEQTKAFFAQSFPQDMPLFQACHPGAGFDLTYEDRRVTARCRVCKTVTFALAISLRASN